MRTAQESIDWSALEEMWGDLHYINLLVPHVISPRERDTLLAAWKLEGQGLAGDHLYRSLGANLKVDPRTAKRYLTGGRKKLEAYQQGVDPSSIVDLRKEVHAICRKLGLEPRMVRSICLTPKGASVEKYLLNEDGKKYAEYDGAGPATETQVYTVMA